MNEHKERKISLAVKFTVIFGVFGIVFSVLNILYTYQTQKKAYYNETENNLNSITTYLNDLIVEEGDEFVKLKNYIAKHGDEMRIPSEKPIDYSVQYENFKRLFSQKHPGKAPGIDIGFDEMDEEVKLAYAEYRFNYWRNVFEEAKDSFNLTYVYFIYPSSEDHMIYYIDPIIAEFEENGKSYIVLNLDVYQDPAKYPGMWEAWETGVSPEKLDVFNNKNGHVYTDYAPVSVNGEKVGLVCADISVQRVDQIVWSVVMRQALGSVLLIIAGVILTGSYVRKTFISRILKLEKEVSAYSGEKDPAIAQSIRAIETGNDEIRSLSDRFADMIAEITDYMTDLKRITAEKERVTAELNLATQIQADMLPRIFPPFPDRKEFDLFASMDPAKEVGGDFYDFFFTDKDHLALVVADVSGKGVPAALFMVIAKTLIKTRALMGGSPGEILVDVNNQLCEGNDAELFVTVWLAIIDLRTGKGVAANAGHEHPALRRRDGSFELVIYKHSPAVATMEGIRFREHEFELFPGDTIVEYSDGVTEATSAAQELFGEERLIASLNTNTEMDPEKILINLRNSIDDFVGEAPQFDDITMLGFIYHGNEIQAKETNNEA